MSVDSGDALVGVGLQQLRAYNLLNGQHHAVLAADANRRAGVLDRLDGVFDLEVATIGRVDGVGQIVARAD